MPRLPPFIPSDNGDPLHIDDVQEIDEAGVDGELTKTVLLMQVVVLHTPEAET